MSDGSNAAADKFSSYTIEIMKGIMLINGGAIIAVTTVIGATLNTDNPRADDLLHGFVANVEMILWSFGAGLLLGPLLAGCAIFVEFFFVTDGAGSWGFQVSRALAVLCGVLAAIAFAVGAHHVVEAVQTAFG